MDPMPVLWRWSQVPFKQWLRKELDVRLWQRDLDKSVAPGRAGGLGDDGL